MRAVGAVVLSRGGGAGVMRGGARPESSAALVGEGGVVGAAGDDGLAEGRVGVGVHGGAPGGSAVRADAWGAAGCAEPSGAAAAVVGAGGVDVAEAGGGEGGEDQRVRAHRLRYALAA